GGDCALGQRPLGSLPAGRAKYRGATIRTIGGSLPRIWLSGGDRFPDTIEPPRRDAGVVDRSGLENRKGRQALGGSNPSPSAPLPPHPPHSPHSSGAISHSPVLRPL